VDGAHQRVPIKKGRDNGGGRLLPLNPWKQRS